MRLNKDNLKELGEKIVEFLDENNILENSNHSYKIYNVQIPEYRFIEMIDLAIFRGPIGIIKIKVRDGFIVEVTVSDGKILNYKQLTRLYKEDSISQLENNLMEYIK